MRLHTDKITVGDVHAATRNLPRVYATVTEHGSRSRDRALEIRLEGNGYARNSGQYGADSDETGATWDEWGAVIGALYVIDPESFWGAASHKVYRDAEDFHEQTGHRFVDGEMPEDTHKRHTWDWTQVLTGREVGRCKKCSATILRAA